MKTFASIYGKLIFGLTILIILAASVFSVPKLFGFQPFVVLSSSMEPVIETGSVLFTNTKDTDVEINDIVTYQLNIENKELLVTHRIIDIQDGLYITKGDNNDVQDMVPLSNEQIIGTYAFHIPKVGYYISNVDQKVIIIAIGWIILLNIFSIALNFITDDEDDEEEEEENNKKETKTEAYVSKENNDTEHNE